MDVLSLSFCIKFMAIFVVSYFFVIRQDKCVMMPVVYILKVYILVVLMLTCQFHDTFGAEIEPSS